MVNIFEDYIYNVNYDIYDVLSTYQTVFDILNINICDYADSFSQYSWEDPDELQCIFKCILLSEAQENGIIPDDVDIESCFDVDCEFAIHSSRVENYKQVVADFKDWCGIELDTF